MNKRTPVDKDGEVAELTQDNFFKYAKTTNQLPPGVQKNLRAVGKQGGVGF